MADTASSTTRAESEAMAPHAHPEMARSPRTHVDSSPLPTDSMVTVPLSEASSGSAEDAESVAESASRPATLAHLQNISSRPDSSEIHRAFGRRDSDTSSTLSSLSSLDTLPVSLHHHACEPVSPPTPSPQPSEPPEMSRADSHSSHKSMPVDWAELEKKEEQEPEPEGEEEAMALLLARLEQENNALLSDSKAGIKTINSRSQSRPPSFNQLKRLVQEEASTVRFSQLPSPPPMTELEFWAALVRDYRQTVQRLPTLCLNKIRGGIPPPLRGVVWQSASGARHKLIEDQYDGLCRESSPYENTINKDLGRSFPGVEMFKDPEGEGQKMLGRVLKCFSLYDHKIGYCQGLGFLVGPLLMQMGDREAFCVLVRLMEDYDLRSCFLPDLSGLHLRIFQFQKLLHQHMPQLAQHLDMLEVESAYLSQWFLSFFAVTCPLPMLFRIYDVLFAEGASETIMRVALALMKRNEKKLLSLSEFEDVMQLLLGRQLWDPYGRNAGSADELVSDFVGFTNDVTREKLHGLEQQYKEAQEKESSKQQVQKSATSFLGRLWGPSNSSTKSAALSPGLSAPSRPVSLLRRSASKQSLASTLNSTAESDASMATQSTILTEVSRASTADMMSLKSGHGSVAMSHSAKDRDFHYQIEQLLISVSQLQRQNSELEAALQRQREDRHEDHRVVRTVIEKLRKKSSTLAPPTNREARRRTTITAASVLSVLSPGSGAGLPADAGDIVDPLEKQFPSTPVRHRASSLFETKEILRETIARTKEQLNSENLRAASLARDLMDRDGELQTARDALKEARSRLQDSYHQNQRLEKSVQELRKKVRTASVSSSRASDPGIIDTPLALSRAATADSATAGLREFRLGRTAGSQSVATSTSTTTTNLLFSKRTSSLATHAVLATENNQAADNDSLLLELVSAKTAEAVAKQELEELRAKLEGMRRVMTGHTPASTPPAKEMVAEKEEERRKKEASVGGGVAAAVGGWAWGGWKRSASINNNNNTTV